MKKFLDKNGLKVFWEGIKKKLPGVADNSSIVYSPESKQFSIKDYNIAKQGQMLVKDSKKGITWIDPLSDKQLNDAVAAATAQATQAGNYAVQAGNYATDAMTSAAQAERINQVTMDWVNSKFWWGDIAEYNQLESIEEGTFYFVQL